MPSVCSVGNREVRAHRDYVRAIFADVPLVEMKCQHNLARWFIHARVVRDWLPDEPVYQPLKRMCLIVIPIGADVRGPVQRLLCSLRAALPTCSLSFRLWLWLYSCSRAIARKPGSSVDGVGLDTENPDHFLQGHR